MKLRHGNHGAGRARITHDLGIILLKRPGFRHRQYQAVTLVGSHGAGRLLAAPACSRPDADLKVQIDCMGSIGRMPN